MQTLKTSGIYILKVIGFSLVILCLVEVLLSIVCVKISSPSPKAKFVATANQIDSFKTALGIYNLDNGVFPSMEQGLQALVAQPSGPSLPKWKGPHLDPALIRVDPWGHPYIYKYPGVKVPNDYDLYSAGPNGVDGDDDDIGNWQ